MELIESEGIRDPRIAEAFRLVSREAFVPEAGRAVAYEDKPISLPERQTTSQPSLIARMIDAVSPADHERVLEIGTGFGFQTALLAHLASEVVSIERFAELAEAARDNLASAGIENVRVIVGNGWEGSREHAPFDCIVVSAAAADMPAALVEQLAEGGRMVIPMKEGRIDQVVLYRRKEGRVDRVAMITPARFVPFVEKI